MALIGGQVILGLTRRKLLRELDESGIIKEMCSLLNIIVGNGWSARVPGRRVMGLVVMYKPRLTRLIVDRDQKSF